MDDGWRRIGLPASVRMTLVKVKESDSLWQVDRKSTQSANLTAWLR
jgi:hypothetical protein